MGTVIPIKGLFEAHIIVRDLQRSVAFYRDVLGLEVGIEQPERPTTFFWVGGRGKSMLGIFTSGSWATLWGKSLRRNIPSNAPPNTHANTIELLSIGTHRNFSGFSTGVST